MTKKILSFFKERNRCLEDVSMDWIMQKVEKAFSSSFFVESHGIEVRLDINQSDEQKVLHIFCVDATGSILTLKYVFNLSGHGVSGPHCESTKQGLTIKFNELRSQDLRMIKKWLGLSK